MSAEIITLLRCDADGCKFSFTTKKLMTATNLRREAKLRGWYSRDSKDLCSWCAASPDKRKKLRRVG